MSILLNKNFVIDTSIDDKTFLTYIALRKLLNESTLNDSNSEDCISCNRLCYILTKNIHPYYLNTFFEGIHNLDQKGLIKIKQSLGNTKPYEFIIDLKNIYLDSKKEYFVIIHEFEIDKILNCQDIRAEKRISILRYFVAVISTFNNSNYAKPDLGKIGQMPIHFIARIASISESTAKRYNKILSDLKLIFIYKANDIMLISGQLRQITNTYSRYSDKSICTSLGKEKENNGHIHKIVTPSKTKQQADHNRSLAQKYHTILNWYSTGQPCKYEKSLVEEIYRYVSNKNKSLLQMIDEKTSQVEQSGQISKSEEEYINRLKSRIRDTEVLKSIIDTL